jgi:shikimate kinase
MTVEGVRRVVLMGSMGSGKSTIGRLLARATGWHYVDNDALVHQATGRTSRELLATEGEDGLRRAEAAAFDRALAHAPPVIVGLAAGTILDPGRRRRLAESDTVVWLRADPATLARRAQGAAHRPWLDGDAEAWFRETERIRAPLYAEVADIEVDTDSVSPQQVVDEILAALAPQ